MKLFGLIGSAVERSPSPKLYNAAFRKRGLPHRYLAFEVEAPYLKNLVVCMKLVDVYGLNVTIPFKEKVIPFLDGLDASAKKAGAVNTIVRKKNRFVGYNTDGAGFLTALRRLKNFDPAPRTVCIAGAGGAARGIAAALAGQGTKKIFLWNRHPARTRRLASFFRKKFSRTEWAVVKRRPWPKADLYVQATPAGLRLPRPCFDIRLSRPEGRRMLACQALFNLKLWTGRVGKF